MLWILTFSLSYTPFPHFLFPCSPCHSLSLLPTHPRSIAQLVEKLLFCGVPMLSVVMVTWVSGMLFGRTVLPYAIATMGYVFHRTMGYVLLVVTMLLFNPLPFPEWLLSLYSSSLFSHHFLNQAHQQIRVCCLWQ